MTSLARRILATADAIARGELVLSEDRLRLARRMRRAADRIYAERRERERRRAEERARVGSELLDEFLARRRGRR